MVLSIIFHFLLTILKFVEPSSTVFTGDIISTTVFSISQSHFYPNVFRHPILSESKHLNVSRLVVDTWSDTAFIGNHVFVEDSFMGKFMTAKAFTMALVYLYNILIKNVLYAYDAEKCETMILEAKNSIYLCDNMHDLVINPIQAEEVSVWV